MNVFGLPILTLLIVLPLVGAAITLFSGRHARIVAIFTTLACLVLALFIWTRLPADGSIGLVERAAWAPSLGIEYHLGVDGLGGLMLVLSAIVTLMAVDAAQHRVHHMPGLFFSLVLTLEAGLFGSFTALNFFHWFLFWELSLIPAFFLIKLWGGPKRGPAATQFFIYTMAGSVALLLSFLAIFLSTTSKDSPGTMDFIQLAQMSASGQLAQMVTAHLGHVMPWLAIGVLAGFAVKVHIGERMNLPIHVRFGQVVQVDHRNAPDGAARERLHHPGADAADADHAHVGIPESGKRRVSVQTGDAAKAALEIDIGNGGSVWDGVGGRHFIAGFNCAERILYRYGNAALVDADTR